jgi:hypothetical protein
MLDTVITLLDDRLFALTHPFELDGRPVSTYPQAARGYSTYNCYFVLDGDQALLIDTGMLINEQDVVRALDDLLPRGTVLSILASRVAEFSSTSNTRVIAERYPINRIMATVGVPSEELNKWLDFSGGWRQPNGNGKLGDAHRETLAGQAYAPIGPRDGSADRKLEIVRTKLQLLPISWLYDDETRTMFTADTFTHMWRATAAGPFCIDEVAPSPTAEQLADFMVQTRFWWLAGANTQPLREDIAEIRHNHPIDCIAPAAGCILRGRAVVDHHFELMEEALTLLADAPPVGAELVPYYAESR